MLFDPCGDCGCPPAGVPCGTCTLPRSNLTLTIANSLLGPRTATLTFNGVDEWTTGCVGQLQFRLRCAGGAAAFTATYYVAGVCPTGMPAVCNGPGSSPSGLTLTAQTCSPLLLRYTTAPCPSLSSQGYTTFTVTL